MKSWNGFVRTSTFIHFDTTITYVIKSNFLQHHQNNYKDVKQLITTTWTAQWAICTTGAWTSICWQMSINDFEFHFWFHVYNIFLRQWVLLGKIINLSKLTILLSIDWHVTTVAGKKYLFVSVNVKLLIPYNPPHSLSATKLTHRKCPFVAESMYTNYPPDPPQAAWMWRRLHPSINNRTELGMIASKLTELVPPTWCLNVLLTKLIVKFVVRFRMKCLYVRM